MVKPFKKIRNIILLLVLSLIVLIFGSDFWVKSVAKKKEYNKVEEVPYNKVGVVLGTSKRLTNGYENLFFKYRIEAAVKLFKAGKISYILVSGDNRFKSYNEPRDMYNELVKKGVPSDKIVLDFAGFRTWDSVLRANKVFGQQSFTIISQKFHNQRAIFIGAKKGLDVVGFDAKDVSIRYGKKTYLREYLARVNVIFDLIVNKEPKFYGEPITIGD